MPAVETDGAMIGKTVAGHCCSAMTTDKILHSFLKFLTHNLLVWDTGIEPVSQSATADRILPLFALILTP